MNTRVKYKTNILSPEDNELVQSLVEVNFAASKAYDDDVVMRNTKFNYLTSSFIKKTKAKEALKTLKRLSASFFLAATGESSANLRCAFVNKHTRSSKGIGVHVDGYSQLGHVFAVVYSACSHDFSGGELEYADSDSGKIHTRNICRFSPQNNSFYAIPGSYVEHSVGKIRQGYRIGVVFFYKWSVSFPDLIRFWSLKDYQCPLCYRMFDTRKTLNAHGKCCKKTCDYIEFKSG